MNIGTLTIEMAANVARIQADMDATKRIVGGTMKDVEQYVGAAKQAFVLLGGVTSIAAFTGVITGAIEAKARLYDLSLQTGISVEALSGLGKIAKFSNTELADVAGASNKLSKALFTQNEDSKGAAQALKALGLEFATFRALKPEDQFVAVAHAMGEFEDGTAKSAAAMLLYGKTGATLLPFLKELEERGFAVGKQTTESALQAKKYEDNLATLKTAGDAWRRTLAEAVLPTMIGVTNAFIDARKGADSFNVAGEAIKITMQTIAVGGANVMFVLRQIGETLGAVEAAKMAVLSGDFRGAGTIFTAYNEQARAARKELDEFENKVLGVQAKISNAGDFLRSDKDTSPVKKRNLGLNAGEDDATKTARDKYQELIKTISEKIAIDQAELASVTKLTEAQKLQAKVFADIDGGFIKLTLDQKLAVDGLLQQLLAIEKLNTAKEEEAKWREESRKELDAELATQLQAAKANRDAVAALQLELDSFGKSREQLQALSSARDRDTAATLRQRAAAVDTSRDGGALADLYRQQADALDQLAAKKDALAAKEAHEANDSTAGATRAVREYLDTVKRAGDATHAVVSNSLSSLEDGLSGLAIGKKFDVKNWVDQIIQEMFRLAVVKPLLASIFGGAGGAGGGGGGGWLSAIGSIAGAYFGSGSGMATNTTGTNLPTSGGRAGGGDVLAGHDYIVGEEGPERLRMGSSSGTVIPNQASSSRAVTVNVTNNGQPVQARSTQRETSEGTIIELMLDAVAHDFNSGGKVHDAASRRFGLNGGGTTPRY